MEHDLHGGPSFREIYADARHELGKGSYGRVREAMDANGDRVAVKTFTETFSSRKAVLQSVVAELLILQRAAHARVVAVLDVFVDREAVRMVFEHGGQALHGLVADGGSVHLPCSWGQLARSMFGAIAWRGLPGFTAVVSSTPT